MRVQWRDSMVQHRLLSLLAVLLLFFPPKTLSAQLSGGLILIPAATYAVEGAPFTAEIQVTHTLPTIPPRLDHMLTGRVVRDSAGRQRFEAYAACSSCPSPEIWIYDVVERKFIHLNPQQKKAEVDPMSPSTSGKVRVPASDPNAWRSEKETSDPQQPDKLPPHRIAGLVAEGTRTSHAAASDEWWVSPLYRMPVMHIHDDPKNGRTEIRIVRFTAGDPDPRLFEVPADYDTICKTSPCSSTAR
jgi:hypothetical protein